MKQKKEGLKVNHRFTYVEHQFTLIEKRIVYNILSRMDSGMNVQPELFSKNMKFSFSWKDLDAKYEHVYKACENLGTRQMRLKVNHTKKEFDLITPFPRCTLENGVITVTLLEDAIPIILELKTGYTTLGLKAALSLSSKYSQRLYELLSGRIRTENGRRNNVTDWDYQDISYIRELLGIEIGSLSEKWHFETRVLKTAQREIKANTDIDFVYEFDKETKVGKQYTTISFTIYSRQDGAEWQDLKMEIANDISQADKLTKMGFAINLLETKYQFTAVEKAIITTDPKATDEFLRVHQEMTNNVHGVIDKPGAYMRASLRNYLNS